MTPSGPSGEALELHWAVSAIDAEHRRDAVALAESRLARGAWDAGDLTPAELERLELLAGAYDIAARDRLEARLALGTTEQRDALRAEVEWGAARAFALHAVLPLPGDPTGRLLRALHLSALSVVAQRRGDWERWLAEHPIARRDEAARWDAYLLRELVELWCELHQRAGPSGLAHAMELLGALREERPGRERSMLARLADEERPRARFYLFALYHLVDAATELFLYLSHGRPPSIERELGMHFALAREATAGDFRLELLLVWLHAAALQVAGRRTAQLEIPGVPA